MMKVAVLLILLLTFASCSNIVGKAIGDLNIEVGIPGVYIDSPDTERINIVGGDTQLFEIYVFATEFDNITGFEYDLNFNGAGISLSQVNYGGAFGMLPDDDYYCLNHIALANQIQQLACTGLKGGANFPVTDQYAYLHNITFLVSTPGTAIFDVPTNGNTILADDNGNSLILTPNNGLNKGPGRLELKVCKDFDNDGYWSTASCGLLDCLDTDNETNAGVTELCDGIDNNCNLQIDEGADCSAYTPTIFSASSAGNDLITTNPILSGTLSFDIIVIDDSFSGDADMDRVIITINGDSITDDTPTSIGPTSAGFSFTGIDSTSSGYDWPNVLTTMTIDAVDLQGLTHSIDVDFMLDNARQCDVTSVTWGSGGTPEIINDNESTTLTLQGTVDCANFGGSLTYGECDVGDCTDSLSAEALIPLPLTYDFDSNSQAIINIPNMLWFDDLDDVDRHPEIKAFAAHDLGITESINLLQIINVAPTIKTVSKNPGLGTAQITVTADEDSLYTLEFDTTDDDSYTNSSQSVGYTPGHTFTLANLPELETTYYFIITAEDIGGEASTTVKDSFTTEKNSGDIIDGTTNLPGSDGIVNMLDLAYAITYFRVDNTDAVLWPDAQLANVKDDDNIINILDLTKIVIQFTVAG